MTEHFGDQNPWRSVLDRVEAATATSGLLPVHLGTPDTLIAAAIEAGCVIARNAVDNQGNVGRLVLDAFRQNESNAGPLWVVDDNLFPLRDDLGPHVANGETLLQDLEALDSLDVGGDLLFVWLATDRISIVHHGGVVFHIRPRP